MFSVHDSPTLAELSALKAYTQTLSYVQVLHDGKIIKKLLSNRVELVNVLACIIGEARSRNVDAWFAPADAADPSEVDP